MFCPKNIYPWWESNCSLPNPATSPPLHRRRRTPSGARGRHFAPLWHSPCPVSARIEPAATNFHHPSRVAPHLHSSFSGRAAPLPRRVPLKLSHVSIHAPSVVEDCPRCCEINHLPVSGFRYSLPGPLHHYSSPRPSVSSSRRTWPPATVIWAPHVNVMYKREWVWGRNYWRRGKNNFQLLLSPVSKTHSKKRRSRKSAGDALTYAHVKLHKSLNWSHGFAVERRRKT